MPTHTASARDAALQRLRRTNRWMIAGSVAVAGVLSDVAANAFSGKTIKASSSTKHSRSARGSSPARRSTTRTQPLSPPAEAPRGSTTTEAPAPQESQQAAPESSQQAAPSREAAPSQEAAPAQEAAPPAVSGGS